MAAPLETDLFEWHFTVRGPPDTAFEGGVYHGRILLPPEYPLKAPEIIMLTPNGRFEVGTRICLSVTSHHDETWQPSWGIRTILTALIGFMPSKPEGIGALDFPDEDRRVLAAKSLSYWCPRCCVRPAELLPPLEAPSKPGASTDTPSSSRASIQTDRQEDATLRRDENAESQPKETPEPPPEAPPADADDVHRQPSSTTVPSIANTSNSVSATGAGAIEAQRANHTRRREPNSLSQERGLLLFAYALVVAIVSIVARRLVHTW